MLSCEQRDAAPSTQIEQKAHLIVIKERTETFDAHVHGVASHLDNTGYFYHFKLNIWNAPKSYGICFGRCGFFMVHCMLYCHLFDLDLNIVCLCPPDFMTYVLAFSEDNQV